MITTKNDTIARFIHVIQPLAQVYDLPPSSLHIFYDISGDLIAFNRNASLFLNLRFFEAWRKSLTAIIHSILTLNLDDAEVKAGNLSKAYISW